MRALSLMGVLSVLATGCSFTTAAGLEECETTADCGADQVCAQKFCLPLPTGCGKIYGSTDPNAVQMGALLPLSTSTTPGASLDESDVQALNAALLALEDFNQRGFMGKQIALHFCDTAGDAERTKKQVSWLVGEKKVAAMLTAGSSQTLAATAVTVPADVLTVSYSASSPELTSLPDAPTTGGTTGLLWRTAPSDAIQGRIIADLLRSDTTRFGTVARVGILYVNDPYGQGVYGAITNRLGTSVASKGFSYPRRGDVKTALAQLNDFDPDITVLMAFADDAVAILKEASTLANLKRGATNTTGHRWFFSDSVKDLAVLSDPQVRDLVQGYYGTAPAQGAGQAFRAFQNAFENKYQKDPSAYAYTSNAYDAMYLLELATAYSLGTTNAVTGPKMAEGLTKLSTGTPSDKTQFTNANLTFLASELAAGRSVNVDGASGQLDFDSAGEAPAPVELWQVQGASFIAIEQRNP
ncbi:ABC transporter substrate-binding protein [Archangium sp.]|uniref:ABC transporter substrate-binding protein n=1 Tax=Archangium sp. TaxID=1872627 RepID=UPI00286B0181|nr:ABC transporter substrate-binding protein [Archangium sp.]